MANKNKRYGRAKARRLRRIKAAARRLAASRSKQSTEPMPARKWTFPPGLPRPIPCEGCGGRQRHGDGVYIVNEKQYHPECLPSRRNVAVGVALAKACAKLGALRKEPR